MIMFWGTCVVFNLNVATYYYCLIFFATLASYSLHWFYTTEEESTVSFQLFRGHINDAIRSLLFFNCIIGSIIILGILIAFPVSIQYMLPPAIATLFYTAPKIPFFKKLEGRALGKTLYLTCIWVYVTMILPFECAQKQISTSAWWYIACQFLFIYLICLLFDYRDRQKDTLHYILFNANQYFNTVITIIAPLFIISLYFFYASTDQLITALAILLPFVFVLITLKKSKNSQSDYWFYLILDGLMSTPALLGVLFHYLLNK